MKLAFRLCVIQVKVAEGSIILDGGGRMGRREALRLAAVIVAAVAVSTWKRQPREKE